MKLICFGIFLMWTDRRGNSNTDSNRLGFSVRVSYKSHYNRSLPLSYSGYTVETIGELAWGVSLIGALSVVVKAWNEKW